MMRESGPRRTHEKSVFPEFPTGTRFLSPSYEIANKSLTGFSPYVRYEYWRQAIKELRSLEGGEEAYRSVREEFIEKNLRIPGDVAARFKQREQKHARAEAWRWTYDDHAEAYVEDMSRIAHELASKFDGPNNPRTHEFVAKVSKKYADFYPQINTMFRKGFYEKDLQIDMRGFPAPNADQVEKQKAHLSELFEKPWDELEESDFLEKTELTQYALRFFPGYREARRIADWEWGEMKDILTQVRSWPSFGGGDKEEYVTLRVNQLQGNPLPLRPYQHAEEALDKLTASAVLSMDCDSLLKFVELYEIRSGREKVWEVMKDALEHYLDDKDHTIAKSFEKKGITFYDDPERYVRMFNDKLEHGLQLEKKPSHR